MIAFLLLSPLAPAANNNLLVTGRFGQALDAGRVGAIVMPRLAYAESPLTVECWVQLRSMTDKNVILSSEPPDSSGHWTLFTDAGSGALAVALTSRNPAEVRSRCNISDGLWHYVAMVLEQTRVRLYVDAHQVADQELKRDPASKAAYRTGWLAIGRMVYQATDWAEARSPVAEPESTCDGLIDEVRISRGVRTLAAIPDAPSVVDADTVALWHMDTVGLAGDISDASAQASAAYLTAGRSMDEIDRHSFKAGPAPLDTPASRIVLEAGAADHPAPRLNMTLDQAWEMAEGGGEAERLAGVWPDAIAGQVPGSVHAALVMAGKIPDPKFGRNDAMAHDQSYKTWWFKCRFPRPRDLASARLVFDGVAIRCTVWLNGVRLGAHEGMFGGPSFDVAALLRDENRLIVKLEPVPGDPKEWNNRAWRTTVAFCNTWGWHYSSIPPLGIWRPVQIEGTPAVRVGRPFVATRDAGAGEVSLVCELQGPPAGWSGRLLATIEPENFSGPAHHFTETVVSAGAGTKLHRQFAIPGSRMWWPNDLGEQNLYRLKVSFEPAGGGPGDHQQSVFGVRTIEMAPLPGGSCADRYDWTFKINGRAHFVKGTGWCTLDSSMDFSRARYARFISLAKLQHVQMLRAWGGGMPETDDFYDLCDRAGILVMQEWPTFARSHQGQPFDVLEETVRLNTLRLRNHPSLAMWGGGNEIIDPFNRVIDMMGRLAIELDGTRVFHRGDPWGGSRHNYGCWWERQPLDHNLQMTAPFWGEFGLASMPVLESVRRYLPAAEQDLWPAPAAGSLTHHTPVFNTKEDWARLEQYSGYLSAGNSLADFIRGSQLSQVVGLRYTLERARARWPDCTGALYYKMNDNYPAASWASVDWYGAPKPAHYFCQQAFAPLHAVVLFDQVDNRARSLALLVVLLDDADALKGARWEVAIRAYDANLRLLKAETFAGHGSIAAPRRLGEFALSAEQTDTSPLFVVAEVLKDGVQADRTFYFVNYEQAKDSLFRLPRTVITLTTEPGTAVLTNTGPLPAVSVAVQRPGHLDTFTAGENHLWLEPGETKRIRVSETEGLVVEAWNR